MSLGSYNEAPGISPRLGIACIRKPRQATAGPANKEAETVEKIFSGVAGGSGVNAAELFGRSGERAAQSVSSDPAENRKRFERLDQVSVRGIELVRGRV
jgi:hypothetical protein